MRLREVNGLLFVTATLLFRDQELALERVILDTGSAGTIFAAERVASIGLVPEPQDAIRELRGIGGTEMVFLKEIDALRLDSSLERGPFEVEIGGMDYGFDLDGIIGTDFLVAVGAVIDLSSMAISAHP